MYFFTNYLWYNFIRTYVILTYSFCIGVKRMKDQTKLRTSALFHKLFKTAYLKDLMEKNAATFEVPAFHTYISQMCSERGQKKESIIKRACIERTYGHQLFNGTRKPSRDKVIQLAIGMSLDMDETQRLLQAAEKSPLYPRIKRDAVVIYGISHRCGMIETQSMLHELGLHILGDK